MVVVSIYFIFLLQVSLSFVCLIKSHCFVKVTHLLDYSMETVLMLLEMMMGDVANTRDRACGTMW